MTDDPGVVDLLGLLAYAELAAFFRLSEDATMAPTLTDRAELAAMAVAEYRHFELLRERLTELGAEPDDVMSPFAPTLDAWHDQTRPANWLEALVKAYVGDGIAYDFYREAAVHVDASTRELVDDVVESGGRASFTVERVRAAVREDPKLRGRLALWARRLVGEGLSQAHRVAAERPSLARLLTGAPGAEGTTDLAEISRMFARLTEEHAKRMANLGLE